MSQQALDLIAIAKKNRATRLDIGNCNLYFILESGLIGF
jgi:hypothetical protein